jgi:hypothetical protein
MARLPRWFAGALATWTWVAVAPQLPSAAQAHAPASIVAALSLGSTHAGRNARRRHVPHVRPGCGYFCQQAGGLGGPERHPNEIALLAKSVGLQGKIAQSPFAV